MDIARANNWLEINTREKTKRRVFAVLSTALYSITNTATKPSPIYAAPETVK